MLCLYCSTKCQSFTTINTISRFGDEDVKALHCKALRARVRIPPYTSISMFMVLLLLFYIITNFVFKMLKFLFHLYYIQCTFMKCNMCCQLHGYHIFSATHADKNNHNPNFCSSTYSSTYNHLYFVLCTRHHSATTLC